MIKIKYFAIGVALIAGMLFGLDAIASAQNCPPNATAEQLLRCGANQVGGEGNAQPSNINDTIENIINVFTVVIGILAIIMIMVAGLRYITSGGDATKTKGAKDTILYAVIGLIIVALAQVIVRFVINNATNSTG